MKIIVAGSRGISKWPVYNFLDETSIPWLLKATEIVSGLAEGPDTWGKIWAEDCEMPVKEFPAEWEKYGKQAGIFRNIAMGNYADGLIAFWDGRSRGTRHMIEVMLNSGKPVHVEIIKTETAERESKGPSFTKAG